MKLTDKITLYNGDCLDVLPIIHDKGIKVDFVLTDPPYGTTQCKWDSIIPLCEMWNQLDLVTQSNTPIALFGAEPFSSMVRMSNIKKYKYDWIWDKIKGTGFLNAKKQPMRNHENIIIFYENQCKYNPQKTKGHKLKTSFRSKNLQTEVYGEMNSDYLYNSTERYPRSIQEFSSDTQNSSLHPTQKPVSLLEYLILTYTNKDDIVLDFTMGSGSTGIACHNTGRKFIGIEKGKEEYDVAINRITNHIKQQSLSLF